MPAWMMKLTPFALRQRSSRGATPSMIVGVLRISSSVKSHWLGSSAAILYVGGGIVVWDLRGGELRVESRGGEGTAGGMSMELEEE